jgi:HIV-1 Vpr-binding protein
MCFADPTTSHCVAPLNSGFRAITAVVSSSIPVSSFSTTSQQDPTSAKSVGLQALVQKIDVAASQFELSNYRDLQQSCYMPLRQYFSTPIHYPSLVVQYLKHQHQQCPASIATLAPLSILHCQVHPEPTHLSEVSLNTAGRLAICQICPPFGGHRRETDTFCTIIFGHCELVVMSQRSSQPQPF